MHKTVLAAMVAMAVTGCAQRDAAMDGLQGQPASTATARFGQPTSTYSEGESRWLVWNMSNCQRSVEIRLGTINRFVSNC
jgi:hypothetical protein